MLSTSIHARFLHLHESKISAVLQGGSNICTTFKQHISSPACWTTRSGLVEAAAYMSTIIIICEVHTNINKSNNDTAVMHQKHVWKSFGLHKRRGTQDKSLASINNSSMKTDLNTQLLRSSWGIPGCQCNKHKQQLKIKTQIYMHIE